MSRVFFLPLSEVWWSSLLPGADVSTRIVFKSYASCTPQSRHTAKVCPPPLGVIGRLWLRWEHRKIRLKTLSRQESLAPPAPRFALGTRLSPTDGAKDAPAV